MKVRTNDFYPLVVMHQKAPLSLHSLVRSFDASALVNKNRSCALSMEVSIYLMDGILCLCHFYPPLTQFSTIIPFAFVEYEIVKSR